MQVVGGADDHRVERLVAKQVLDVVEGVLHREPVGERPGLRQVDVADGGDLDRFELPEHGRWATWVMAPPPMTPTRGARMPSGPRSCTSLSTGAPAGAGIVRRDDLAVVLARARAGPPLPTGRTHAVPRAAAVRYQPGDPTPGPGSGLRVKALLRSGSPDAGRSTWRTAGPLTRASVPASATTSSPTRPEAVRRAIHTSRTSPISDAARPAAAGRVRRRVA